MSSLPGAAAVRSLEQRLEAISRVESPEEWAVASYRLGLALSETPDGRPADNLRVALGHLEAAADVLTAERAPVEHARIVNAAGSAHRLLGAHARAGELFARAVDLMDGRARGLELAGALSNLGLCRVDAGDHDGASEAFHRALDLLQAEDGGDPEAVRTRVAVRYNVAQALSATGRPADLDAAVEALEAASTECGSTDDTMHRGMVWHALGVARKGQSELRDGDRDLLERAIRHFEDALTVFTSTGFPFHHAVALQNLGLALGRRGDLGSERRALACYEEALGVFDPRLHAAHWQATHANLRDLEESLAVVVPGATRQDHFATLLGDVDEVERLAMVRRRLARFEAVPGRRRVDLLAELASAVVRQPPPSFVATLRTMVTVLMELPDDMLRDALEAQLLAHAGLEAHDRRAADFILDEAIDLLLFGPQRIRVRDLLHEIGWERP